MPVWSALPTPSPKSMPPVLSPHKENLIEVLQRAQPGEWTVPSTGSHHTRTAHHGKDEGCHKLAPLQALMLPETPLPQERTSGSYLASSSACPNGQEEAVPAPTIPKINRSVGRGVCQLIKADIRVNAGFWISLTSKRKP